MNLEAPLKIGDPLDGHLVTGHVDGVGEVVDLAPAARSTTVRIRVPEALSCYVAQKGSIAVDGVSLTVNAVQGDTFEVNVIPHTQAVTVIGEYGAASLLILRSTSSPDISSASVQPKAARRQRSRGMESCDSWLRTRKPIRLGRSR